MGNDEEENEETSIKISSEMISRSNNFIESNTGGSKTVNISKSTSGPTNVNPSFLDINDIFTPSGSTTFQKGTNSTQPIDFENIFNLTPSVPTTNTMENLNVNNYNQNTAGNQKKQDNTMDIFSQISGVVIL